MNRTKLSFFSFGKSKPGNQEFKPGAIGLGAAGADYSPGGLGRSAARVGYARNQTNIARSPGSNPYSNFAGGLGSGLGRYAFEGAKTINNGVQAFRRQMPAPNAAARNYIPGYAAASDYTRQLTNNARNSGLTSAVPGYIPEMSMAGAFAAGRKFLPSTSKLRAGLTPKTFGVGQGISEIGQGLFDIGRLATGNVSSADYLRELDNNTMINGSAPSNVGSYMSSALNSYRNGIFGNAFRGLESAREIYNRGFDNSRRQNWWGSNLSAPLTDEIKQRYATSVGVPSQHMPGSITAGIPQSQVHSDPSSWLHLARARSAGWDMNRESYDDFVKNQNGWNPATQTRSDWVANPL